MNSRGFGGFMCQRVVYLFTYHFICVSMRSTTFKKKNYCDIESFSEERIREKMDAPRLGRVWRVPKNHKKEMDLPGKLGSEVSLAS